MNRYVSVAYLVTGTAPSDTVTSPPHQDEIHRIEKILIERSEMNSIGRMVKFGDAHLCHRELRIFLCMLNRDNGRSQKRWSQRPMRIAARKRPRWRLMRCYTHQVPGDGEANGRLSVVIVFSRILLVAGRHGMAIAEAIRAIRQRTQRVGREDG